MISLKHIKRLKVIFCTGHKKDTKIERHKKTQKYKLVECFAGHVVPDNLSELKINWFYCKKCK